MTKVKVKYLNQEKKQVMVGSSEKALSLKTGVEALPHFEHRFCEFLKKKKSEVTVLVPQSCPTLCDLCELLQTWQDCNLPGSPVDGIHQARILEG